MTSSIPKHLIKGVTAVIFKTPIKKTSRKLPRKIKKFNSARQYETSPASSPKCSLNSSNDSNASSPILLVNFALSDSPSSPAILPKINDKNNYEDKGPVINLMKRFPQEELSDEENDEIEMDTPTRQKVSRVGLDSLSKPPSILGKGGFGVVIKALHKGHKIAVKIINKERRRKESIDYCLAGEMNALTLKHPNIAQTLGVFGLNERNLLIFMEFAGPKSLQQILDDPAEEINWLRRLKFAIEIIDALQYCHSCNMVHLDVKPANVVLSLNDSCKLCDFGCSKKLDDSSEFYHTSFPPDGTVVYKAPELLRGFAPTLKADVYSYGITLWQMLTRKTPFPEVDPHIIIYKVVAYDERPSLSGISILDYVSKRYVNLFTNCWQSSYEVRPTCIGISEAINNIFRSL